ncbi:MAG: HNH endonuclease [Nitrospirales bacterium]|nr:HNH endonuclease [Nitrospirales bacterium]
MSKHQTKEKNGMWKGGRSIASNGYVLIRVGKDHHLADCRGYAYEHRLVAEEKLGRRLRPGEQVHHIDGNTQHNSPSNIEVVDSHATHRERDGKRNFRRRILGQKNPVTFCACGCGESFNRFDNSGRPRRFVSGHNMMKQS